METNETVETAEQPTCLNCRQDAKHCGVLLLTENGWLGLAHMPKLGRMADRRSFRSA